MTLSSESYSNSAIVFSSSLLQRLEGHERLPTTYIGVRRVRDEDPPSTSSSRRRRPPPPPLARQDDVLAVATAEAVGVCSGGSNKEEGGYDEDDAWVPNELMTTCSRSGDENCTEILPPPPSSSSSIRLTDNQNEGENDEEENERTIQQNSKVAPIIFRITDPNDDSTTSTGRRMTSREKKQFKYQLKQVQQSVRKEERQRLHEQRIQEAKKEKAERKRVKRLAWQAKKLQQQLHQYEEQPQPQQQQQQQANDEQTAIATKMCNRMAKVPGKQVDHNIPKNDAPTPTSVTVPTAKRKGAGPAALPPTPAMLTPAATTTACLIRDLGLFLPPVTLHEQHSDNISSSTTESRFRRRRTTIMDSDLSTQWANKLLHTALTPADVSRSKEEMRPMAYRLVPEVWARLCPDSLWTVEAEAVSTTTTMEDADAETAAANAVAFPNSSTEPNAEEGNTNINKKQTQIHEPREGTTTITTAPTFDTLPSPIATTTTTCYVPNHDYAFAQLRTDTSSYDQDASLIVQHLHQYSNLYIACGAIFGCDLLLYDGPRDVRHSFAGVRIYCCKSRRRRSRTDGSDNMNEKEGSGSINDQLPIPSAYDMAGFVRTMNSARKIALLATVVRDVDDGGGNDVDNSPPRSMATTSKPTYRIAIVDLALEKVLSAPTHVRKGNTKKRRSEEDAANGLAK